MLHLEIEWSIMISNVEVIIIHVSAVEAALNKAINRTK